MTEPLSGAAAKKLIVAILAAGTLSFSSHAYEEMANDDLDESDVRNVLRGGICRRSELVAGSWRYCIDTARLGAVIAFRTTTHAVVVTAWRIKKR